MEDELAPHCIRSGSPNYTTMTMLESKSRTLALPSPSRVSIQSRMQCVTCVSRCLQGPSLFEVLDSIETQSRDPFAPFRMPIMDRYRQARRLRGRGSSCRPAAPRWFKLGRGTSSLRAAGMVWVSNIERERGKQRGRPPTGCLSFSVRCSQGTASLGLRRAVLFEPWCALAASHPLVGLQGHGHGADGQE